MDGQYNNNQYNYNQYNQPQKQKKPIWAAVTSFILSLANIVLCCCTTYVFAPLSIVFGIVSLAKKWGGKGLSIAGIIISSLSLVMVIISSVLINTTFKEPYQDMMKLVMNPDKYIEEYQETGDVPEDFQKYCDPKYDGWWKSMGYDDFNEFFDDYMKGFIDSYERYGGSYDNNSNDSYDDDYDDSYDYDDNEEFFDDYGEEPVEL